MKENFEKEINIFYGVYKYTNCSDAFPKESLWKNIMEEINNFM